MTHTVGMENEGDGIRGFKRRFHAANERAPHRLTAITQIATMVIMTCSFVLSARGCFGTVDRHRDVMSQVMLFMDISRSVESYQRQMSDASTAEADALNRLAVTQEKATDWERKFRDASAEAMDLETLARQIEIERGSNTLRDARMRTAAVSVLADEAKARNLEDGIGLFDFEVLAPPFLDPRQYDFISVRLRNRSRRQFHGRVSVSVVRGRNSGCVGDADADYYTCRSTVREPYTSEANEAVQLVKFDVWMTQCGAFRYEVRLYVDPPEGSRTALRSFRVNYVPHRDGGKCRLVREH